MSGIIGWAIFLLLGIIAIVTAAGMLVTMSMYRAGLALMASFVALAGIFLLLDADLPAAIQIMMNVGGMLIMVLFMVMFMMDPGGEMMWGMKRSMHMRGVGAFAMATPRGSPPTPLLPEHDQSMEQPQGTHGTPDAQIYTCPMHAEVQQDHPGTCPKCSMQLVVVGHADAAHEPMTMAQMPHGDMAVSEKQQNDMTKDAPAATIMSDMDMIKDDPAADMSGMDMGGLDAQQNHQMMVDMAMSTAQMPWALVIGAATAIALIALVILTPWSLAATGPTRDASAAVGTLLLGRYMVGFEGAAFLIVAGIAGAVILGRRELAPMPQSPMQMTQHQEQPGQACYTCPMHPEIQQDHPGKCPKCRMDLIPERTTTSAMPMQNGALDIAIEGVTQHDTTAAGSHDDQHHHGGAR